MIVALCALLATQPASTSGRTLVDAVAAVVERRVITMSEVEAEARLVLLERAGPAAAEAALDSALLDRILDVIVVQELLALDARRTGVAVREVDIDARVGAVRARFGAPDDARVFLAQHAIDEELLRTRARRDLAAEALLRRVFNEIRVSDDEAQALLTSRPELIDVNNARGTLEKQRKEARLSGLIEKLRREVEVRVVWRP